MNKLLDEVGSCWEALLREVPLFVHLVLVGLCFVDDADEHGFADFAAAFGDL